MKLFGSKDKDTILPRTVNFDEAFEQLLQVRRPLGPVNDFAPTQNQLVRRRPERAQPSVDEAVRVIHSFAALPTKQIDDAIAAAEDNLADLKMAAQKIRNAYVGVTDDLLALIAKQQQLHKLAADAFGALEKNCAAVDQPTPIVQEPAAPEQTDGEQTQEPDGTERAA